MKSQLFIPKTLKIGYQERTNTYTGKLAYVTYYDHKNIVRKESSWESWRDKKIEPSEFENIPTSGFVLNKQAGGGRGWDGRATWIRCYDPRGFELELSVENLLFILDNANSIKGKGLEGEFVYSWSGKDLILLPCDCDDYKEAFRYTSLLYKSNTENVYLSYKELKCGYDYIFKDNSKNTYLGIINNKHTFFTGLSKWNNKNYCFEQFDNKQIKNKIFKDSIVSYNEEYELLLEKVEFDTTIYPKKSSELTYFNENEFSEQLNSVRNNKNVDEFDIRCKIKTDYLTELYRKFPNSYIDNYSYHNYYTHEKIDYNKIYNYDRDYYYNLAKNIITVSYIDNEIYITLKENNYPVYISKNELLFEDGIVIKLSLSEFIKLFKPFYYKHTYINNRIDYTGKELEEYVK